MTAATCRSRGRYAALAVSLLILLVDATSLQVTASDFFGDESKAEIENKHQGIRVESRQLSAKAGDKPGHHVHHGPRHSKTGKEAALPTTAAGYVELGKGGGKSGKDIAIPQAASEEISVLSDNATADVDSGTGSGASDEGDAISMTTPTTSPNLAGLAPESMTNTSDSSNTTTQNLGEVGLVASTDSAQGMEMSSTTSSSKASKKELSSSVADVHTPFTTSADSGGVSTNKGGDVATKSGKAAFGEVVTYPDHSEENDPISKAYKEPIASSMKPKANKTPLTQYFVKESSYHADEDTSSVMMSGKSGKGAWGISNVDSSMSFNLDLTGKAAKAGGSTAADGMIYDSNPDVVVPVPPVEFVTSSPMSLGAQSGVPTPLLLLTLPPTLPPAMAGTLPPGTSSPPVGVRFGSDAKYWPHDAMDGTGKCEFSSNYPPEFAQEQLREVYLFDTLEECCAMYELFCLPTFPTYSPTGDVQMEEQEPRLSTQGEHVVALEPFGVKLFAEVAEPRYNEETVLRVTKEHLTHSFRTHGYEVGTMKLMLLEHERHLLSEQSPAVAYSAVNLRWLEQHPVFILVVGGAIEFASGAKIPSPEEIKTIVEASFSGERLAYYIELLNEADMDVAKAELDLVPVQDATKAGETTNGFNWSRLAIGMSSAFVGISLIAVGSRQIYKRRHLSIDDLDLEKGIGEDYTIRLQYTNDELEATVDETATHDQLSVPSLVQGIEEEVNYQATPSGTTSYSSYERSGSKGNISEISPLESPQGTNKEVTKRYISVFTVKKDCGGKTLDQIDLRALAIAYLSRMLKKFPNTCLLPHDKSSSLPAIIHIRDIPDEIEVLHQYIGNARVDEKSGKVLFNLRVESDAPVSKMKSNTSMSSSGSSSKRVRFNASPAIDADSTPKKQPDSPNSSESMEDVDL
jgi:hypothetical protein